MRRFFISVLGGILLPGLLFLSASFITWLFPQYDLGVTKINGTLAPGYIFAPVAIPLYIDILYPTSIGYFVAHSLPFGLLVLSAFNFFLYTLLTFAAIKYFNLFKSRKKAELSSAPPPPESYKEKFEI